MKIKPLDWEDGRASSIYGSFHITYSDNYYSLKFIPWSGYNWTSEPFDTEKEVKDYAESKHVNVLMEFLEDE